MLEKVKAVFDAYTVGRYCEYERNGNDLEVEATSFGMTSLLRLGELCREEGWCFSVSNKGAYPDKIRIQIWVMK